MAVSDVATTASGIAAALSYLVLERFLS